MTGRIRWGCAALLLRLLTSSDAALAQEPESPSAVAPADTEPPVLQYDLSGPRAGVTISPNGDARSQFGWHMEHQASPGARGPWFVVETVLLVGGVEYRTFVPNGTLIFGFRLPSGYEFGIGPSYLSESNIGNRQKGSNFQFSDHFGVGVSSADGHWRAGFAFRHISNLSIRTPNNAVDFKGVAIEWTP